MAIAFVQSTTGSGTTTTLNTTNFGSSVTSGNLIVITITDDSGGTTAITSVTDTGGNTYTRIFIFDSTATTQMWYAKNVTGGASFHVTTTRDTSASRVTIVAQEFSGCDTVSPLDKFTNAFDTGTAVSSGPTSATAVADELIVTGYGHGGTTSAFTAGSGYTNQGTVNVANAAIGQASKIVSSIGTQTGTATIAASRDWVCGVATFKISGSAAIIEQEGFGFYKDDGSESTMTTLAAQDVSVTRAKSTNTILRALINTTNDAASQTFQIEYRQVGDSGWTKINP